MSVDFANLQTEPPQLVGQGTEIRHLGGGAEPLQTVEVDDRHDRSEPMMGEKDQSFPG